MVRRRADGAREAQERATQELGSMTAGAGDAWMEGQAALFNHIDMLARRWLERRREALDATRDSLEEMRRCRDFAEVIRIQQDWLCGSMQRLGSDFSEFTTTALNLSQGLAARAVQEAETASEHLERAEHATLSAAGAKPHRR